MTILIVSYNAEQILMCADTFSYETKSSEPEITHENIRDHVIRVLRSKPKIIKLGENSALVCGGSLQTKDVIENLDLKKDLAVQIAERLKQHHENGSWICRLGSWNGKKCEVTTVAYRDGAVSITNEEPQNTFIDSFSKEVEELFKTKHFPIFCLAPTTNDAVDVLEKFFEQVTELYTINGKVWAGGEPTFAIVDKGGFKCPT